MKKHFKTGIASIFVAFAMLLVLPSFTSAQRPDDAGSARGAVQAQEASERGSQARVESEARTEEVQAKVEAKQQEIRAKVEERQAAIKQNVCERREQALKRAMPNLANGAENVKNSFDTVYERVQGFYEKGQLTVEDYETLTANVDAAKVEAEASLGAVQEFTFELDCENPNVAEQMASYRESIVETRESLKTYREELVALLSAMRAEAATQQDENGTEDDTEGVKDEEGASDAS